MEKNIVFFNFSDSGFYSHRADYAKKLIKDGYNVFLISQIKNHKKKIEDLGINIIKLPIKKRYNFNPYKILKIIFFLNQKIKKINPKIINNIGIIPVILGTIAAIGRNTKVINSLTGLGSLIITNNFKNLILLNILKSIFIILLQGSTIIVQNKIDKNFFINLRFKKSKIFLIPGYGIKTNLYKKSKQRNNPPKIILHSRLLRVKGIYEFVEAANLINKYKFKAIFYLYGSLDRNNPDSLQKQKNLLFKSNKYFRFMGEDNQIRFKLHKFDIACLPSYREGLPRSLLECMASQLPIITTNAPGNTDLVINKFNGLKVNIKSTIKLTKALDKLILNKKLRFQMGLNSLKFCEKKFSTSVIFKKLDKIFRC